MSGSCTCSPQPHENRGSNPADGSEEVVMDTTTSPVLPVTETPDGSSFVAVHPARILPSPPSEIVAAPMPANLTKFLRERFMALLLWGLVLVLVCNSAHERYYKFLVRNSG